MLWRLKRISCVTSWNPFFYLFVCFQLCVCVCLQASGGIQSLIMTHTYTNMHINVHFTQPAWNIKKKEIRWGNWLVMWGNSNPIIPNNSLPQHTSSSLILQNPPQLIPDRLADILSFIYQPPRISFVHSAQTVYVYDEVSYWIWKKYTETLSSNIFIHT